MPKGKKTYISQSRFAREVGLSQQYINELVASGVIPVNDKKKVNPTEAKKAIANKIVKDDDKDRTLVKARTMKARYEGELKKLKYEEECCRLIDRVKFEGALLVALGNRDTIIKRHLLSIPTRIAVKLDNPEQRKKIKALIMKEVREVLTELSEIDLNEVQGQANE